MGIDGVIQGTKFTLCGFGPCSLRRKTSKTTIHMGSTTRIRNDSKMSLNQVIQSDTVSLKSAIDYHRFRARSPESTFARLNPTVLRLKVIRAELLPRIRKGLGQEVGPGK